MTIHALLHIADGIKAVGPVWTAWSYPMERYCGSLLPAITSRHFPYATLDKYVTAKAQMMQIMSMYNLAESLSLGPSRTNSTHKVIPGCLSLFSYSPCAWLIHFI